MNAMEAKVTALENAVVATAKVVYKISQGLGTVCQLATGSDSRLGGARNVVFIAVFCGMLLFCATGLYSIFFKDHAKPAACAQVTTSRVILVGPASEESQ